MRILEIEANSVVQDEMAHYEPPHMDLHGMQVKLFSFLAL